MVKNKQQNLINNLIKTIFKALESTAKVFSVSGHYAILVLTLILTASLVSYTTFAALNKPKLSIDSEKIIVFSSDVTASGWSNVSSIGNRELGEDSLLQNFSISNSAQANVTSQVPSSSTPPLVSNPVTPVFDTPLPTEQPTIFDPVQVVETTLEENGSDPVTEESEVVTEPVKETANTSPQTKAEPTSEPKSEIKPEVKPEKNETTPAEVTSSSEVSAYTGFKTVTGLYALLQASTGTAVSNINVISSSAPEEEYTLVVVKPEIFSIVPEEEVVEPESEPKVDIELPKPINGSSTTSNQSATSTKIQEVVKTNVSTSTPGHNLEEKKINKTAANNNSKNHEIVLRNFSAPELAPGQFINNLQLRLSMAGDYKIEASSTPALLKARYSFGTFAGEAGAILLENEFSNALNGGYFVLSLPSIDDISILSDLEITLNFEGDESKLKSLFIDSVWVEVGTIVYDKEALKQRTLPSELRHLAKLEKMSLLSEITDFSREELPRFNLKYNSQRNFVVKAFRSIFADDLAEIKAVTVSHNAEGKTGVEPNISITSDGLVSIIFNESDKERMKPGVYTVEVEVDEGGYTSVDTFEFQWGLLSINTNQTEYVSGNTVKVSMGALTPNGNTICDANLNLFVTDPRGLISNYPVITSGLCFGNNVIDVPDYSTEFVVEEVGKYDIYLERTSEQGEALSHTVSSFDVTSTQNIVIERNGPTRIFPPAPYAMELSVHTFDQSFSGRLVERVPNSFIIKNTEAKIVQNSEYTELVWDFDMLADETETVSYEFDAPDLSPYLFELGPAKLVSSGPFVDRVPTESVLETIEQLDESVLSEQNQSSQVEEVKPPDVVEIVQEITATNTIELESDSELEPETMAPVTDSVKPTESIVEPEPERSNAEPVSYFDNFLQIIKDSFVVHAEIIPVGSEEGPIQLPEVEEEVSLGTETEENIAFMESRSWQIASDAVGNMIIFWDNGASIPAGWSCLSCGSGTFFQRFVMASSTYNNTGGATTHTHTANGSVFATNAATTYADAKNRISNVAHAHTYTPSINTVNHLPLFRNLRVIQYTSAAGEPPTLPSGAIGIFDATVPAGFTRYSAQDGRFVYGENTPGTTGGNATHNHTITGTTGPATGPEEDRAGNAANAALPDHTHTVSSSTLPISNDPAYINVILGKADSATTTPEGFIAMWTDQVPTYWLDVSSASSSPFSNKFIRPTSTYGGTGGANSHAPADVIGIISSTPVGGGTDDANAGIAGAAPNHTHLVNVTGFSNTSNLPPFITAVFGRRQGISPVYNQKDYLWYTNLDAQTPTDPWPSGGVDLLQNTPITNTTTPVKNGDVIRLRVSTQVSNSTSTAGALQPKLQFGVANTCSAVASWTDVGSAGSSTVWRGYDNSAVADGSTLSSTTLASTTVLQTYEESHPNAVTPNQMGVGAVGEWDFVIQQNGATAGTNYCFRLVRNDGTPFFNYVNYPKLFTNQAPVVTSISAPFDNAKSASTTPHFLFEAGDAENDKLHYEISVDNDYDFSSPIISRNTISDSTYFENQVLTSDKAPYIPDNLIRFIPPTSLTNGTTYYWRIRSSDPSGSNKWGNWSVIKSFTIDTSITASAWFQTTEEQFATNALVGTKVNPADTVDLITGSTTGTMTSTEIDFDDRVTGTVWGSLSFSDVETASNLKYTIQYKEAGVWANIPDSALPGNSAGFGTTVSLIDLDTEIYNIIRIRATFTNSGSSPVLNNWTVSWGYRVETPVITKLFANEKVATTTPTFEFVTSDPQGDDLTYQVQWSTDYYFSASTTRTSNGTPVTGFVNRDNGADTDPFFSGQVIQFTIQGTDALTNTSTYWWRVRAKDPLDSNTYSLWTNPQSFTVDTGTQVSTWFQTVKSQFDNNLNTGVTTTVGAATVSTVASEAMIVYGEGNVYTPRYRTWNGTTWSAEGTALDVGAPINWVITEAAPTREEYIAMTLGTDGDVNAQVYANGEWGNLLELTATVNNASKQGFALAYESISGDALAITCDGDEDPTYYIWNGTSWSGPSTLNANYGGNCEWIKIAANPTSDEIVVAIKEDGDGRDADAFVWNGSSWGTGYGIGRPEVGGAEGFDIAYEESGNQALFIVQDRGNSRFVAATWNGTTWSSLGNVVTSNPVYFSEIAVDQGTDNAVVCYVGSGGEIGVVRWTGSAWTGLTTLDATANSNTDRPVSCQFETIGSRDGYIMVTYSDDTNTRYRFWNGSSWSTEASISTLEDASTVQSRRTGEGKILTTVFDDVNDWLAFSSWNGTSWSTTTILESNPSVSAVPYKEPFMIAVRKPSTKGNMTGLPVAAFSSGSGPYWNRMSWVDSEPGGSSALYKVQYLTSSSTWALVPDSAIPGNSIGTTTSPIILSGLSVSTYNKLRPVVAMSCNGASCPTVNDWTIEWAGGINISGTIKAYDQTTNVNSGTVAVAVNGILQLGKTSAVSAGTWSISNVNVPAGAVVTTFLTGATDTNEAVGIAKYDGDGDMSGIELFVRHISIGSNDVSTSSITNVDLGSYDYTNTEDIFYDVTGTSLVSCMESACADAEIIVKANNHYSPGGNVRTHDFENNGTFTAGSFTFDLNGSWDNNATTSLSGSNIIFSATNTSEVLDNTGAISTSFNNITFGTTTGNGTWTLVTALDVLGNLTVSRGTLVRGTLPITISGNLTNGANGLWNGIGTTTFNGGVSRTWSDQNATLQNVGRVVVDGTTKVVTLAGNVAAESVTIGGDDTLDVTNGNHSIRVFGNWFNQNNFLPRAGDVIFSATSTGKVITTGGVAFYNLSFSGAGGGWSFASSTLAVNNNLTIATGTVTMPTATTTVGGSFNSTGGLFAHNNGTLSFTGTTPKTITFAGGAFTNTVYNLDFNGAGSWSMLDTNATSSNNVTVRQGTVTFPSGIFAIGAVLNRSGGTFSGGTGTVRFYSSVARVLTAGTSNFNHVDFRGTGSWSFSDTNVSILGNLLVSQGTLTLPNGTSSIGGSFTNSAVVNPGTGTVNFNATSTGRTLNFGNSPLYNVTFAGASGGWNITNNATTTNNFNLNSAGSWTLTSGRVLAVGGTFTNNVGGASTTWTGTTLTLISGGAFTVNSKLAQGDIYNTLNISSSTKVSIWNSFASSYVVGAGSYLYSQDHAEVDGQLNIFGDYTRTSGTEHWSFATDFDGVALGGGSGRLASIRFASGAQASFSSSTLSIIGTSTASTSISNQGSGTYVVNVSGGTTTARYYAFSDLGATGLSLLASTSVPQLLDGSYTVATAGGTALTVSSTTIDANPAKQIYNVRFSTTTAISAKNVTQTDGAPVSYWWFREGSGNMYGEAYDNDTGNPGSIRFDDSALTITVSGTVYSDGGVTPLLGGTCNGSTPVVRVVVQGGTSYTGSCSATTGNYSIPGVTIIGNPTLTVYLDNASGGERGAVITQTPTTNITNMHIYANRVIVRNEDVDPLTTANLAVYDNSKDTDLRFIASTSTSPSTLTVLPGNELFVYASSTFAPGGTVTLGANAQANSYDGTLYIDDGATFIGNGTSTYTIGGRMVLDPGAVFTSASSTVLMNATTTGKSITASSEVIFHNLTFNGVGGGWNLGANLRILGNMNVTQGTVTGTTDITLVNGSLTGNGILSLGDGITTLEKTNSLGGTSAWTFYSLKLGSGVSVGTTTPLFTSTTTISGRLTISNAHFLSAGSSKWDLAGTGNVFEETGTYLEDTSTIRFSGAGSNVISTGYYNLNLDSGSGSQTYTATGLGIIVANDLVIGGTASSTFDVNTNDPALNVNGNVFIRTNGNFGASNTGLLTVAGNYDNDGVFNGNSGKITFDGTGTTNIYAGLSSFANVDINGTGTFVVQENATATVAWRLLNHSNFTVNSGLTLAVGGSFINNIAGANTTWTGSNLSLFGNGIYEINPATTSESYGTLTIASSTQIQMWNSGASTYAVNANGSLYSQDHGGVDGDLYIFGKFTRSSGAMHWSYATDFNGNSLTGGGERVVSVNLASSTSVSISGGSLAVIGVGGATTTIQNQSTGTYSLSLSGNASSTFNYYRLRNLNSAGLSFSGSVSVPSLSYGDIEVSQNAGTAITVSGSVITANPARNFIGNRFALNGVGSGYNVTVTGSSTSSWRFVSHYGDIAGEAFDIDPAGDPGYVSWEDSSSLITIAGNVYSDEGTTVSSICNGSTNNVRLVVSTVPIGSTSCNATTGAYSFTNVAYGSSDSLVVFIDGMSQKGSTVSKEPISNISNLHIYENRVIVRHENTNPITIENMATYDSSDDTDINYTATLAATNTLALPANTKLLIWSAKTFRPTGNVTIAGGGAGGAHDGTLEAQTNAVFQAQGAESHSVGGSLIMGTGAVWISASSTLTMTTTGSSRTFDVNNATLHNLTFTGSGSWNITDTNLTIANNYIQSAGNVGFPTATTTIGRAFNVTGGSFTHNGSPFVFTASSAGNTVRFNNSAVSSLRFTGTGSWNMTDTNATSTGSVNLLSGAITLPNGNFTVGGNFIKSGGSLTHNNSNLIMTATTTATLTVGASDLYAIRFAGPASFTITDNNITFRESFTVASGSVLMATGTTAVGGSFTATGGTFNHATGTVLLNATSSGKTINPGVSKFYNLQIGAPSGGYTFSANATTTNNFTIAGVNNLTFASSTTFSVQGVFTNSVGGSATTWTGATLALLGSNAYTINTKALGGDQYNTLIINADSDIRMWNSGATSTNIAPSSSLYSQDHNAQDGSLYIYGDFHISTTTEYWNYAKDFDGTNLGGSSRAVTVAIASGATTTLDGGSLFIVGTSGNETTITNQGSGNYSLGVSAGNIDAQYYRFRNLDVSGLNLSGTPVINSLSYGDYELSVNGGSLITLSSTTLNFNASLVNVGNRFATTSAITGTNVNLIGSTTNAWYFSSHTGNLAGENFDSDGATACGSIRWSDSSCLLLQQREYRWRNDDGGLEVPDAEWYNTSWDTRKRVRVKNLDATNYTNAVVKLNVTYDSDMRSDFQDLRFTSGDGTTTISYWLGTTTNSVSAEVWLKLPSLPASDTATAFMYYNNPTATTTSSGTAVFSAFDNFEDNNITEYSGQTGLFSTNANFKFSGSYGLGNTGQESSRANLGGIFRFDQSVSQGQTFRYMQYVNTGTGASDEPCTLFGVQSPGTTNQNYGLCLEQFGTDRISLVRNVVDNDASGTILASTTVTYNTGWYEVEIKWGTDNSLQATLYTATGTQVASVSATDSTYTTGGYGFTYWFHNGGWDNISSRPTITTKPTVLFGVKQTDGGATWNNSQNQPGDYAWNDIARLRIAVENSGLGITNQQFVLEYAGIDAAPNCEAVSSGNYVPVPVQASCGTSPICMQSSSNVTNGASTVDLLTGTDGNFVAGEARENPSNSTGNLNIDQDYYTELEYVLTPTVNSNQNYCFRVTKSGTPLDFYGKIAQLSLRLDPYFGDLSLNNGLDIALTPATTTAVYVTGTTTDLNGYSDLAHATATIYRSGVGASCTPDNNNCFILSTETGNCSFTNCAGNSCLLSCRADIPFHAEPTDFGTYEGQEWLAYAEVEDASAGYDFTSTAMGVELSTLRALQVDSLINYGSLEVNSDTGSYNASTTVINSGNVPINIDVEGVDMTDGGSSFIPADQQKMSTSTFSYSACVSCYQLSSTTPVVLGVNLSKPTVTNPPVETEVYWGIAIPYGINSKPHSGINTFTPIDI